MKKVAIYLRKSRGVDSDLQKHKELLINFCKRKGYSYDVYGEIASGVTLDRKEFRKLLSNISKYSSILVTELSRISRDEENQAYISKVFRENNISVMTPDKSYDLSVEADIMLTDFHNLLSRQEMRIIRRRLKVGKLASFKRGNCITKPPFPYKYDKENQKLFVEEKDYNFYREVVKMALKGQSPKLIEGKLKLPAQQVRRMLDNPVHRGFVKYDKKLVKGHHRILLTEDEYKIIQKFKSIRCCGIRKSKHRYTLTNLAKCQCGYTRSIKYRSDRKNSEAIVKCNYCKDVGFVTTGIHTLIKKDLYQYEDVISTKLKFVSIDEPINSLNLELDILNKNTAMLDKKKDKVNKLIINDMLELEKGKIIIDELNEKCTNDLKRKSLVEKELECLKNKQAESITTNDIVKVLTNNITKEELNQLYTTFIEKVIISDKKGAIKYK